MAFANEAKTRLQSPQMKRCLLSLLISIHSLHALDLPPGGADVRGDSPLQANASPTAGKVESLTVGKRITITKAELAIADF